MMRKLLFCLALLATVAVKAQMDSLSYALGYTSAQEAVRWHACVADESDARDFIRGLEDRMLPQSLLQDTCFMYNYCAGSMQGIFLSDGFTHGADSLRPPVDCIVEGLRRVAIGKVILPEDSIEAIRFIDACPDSVNPVRYPAALKCRFFTAYGLMKGLQPGLRQYLDELGVPHVEACQQYYAHGMADALTLICTPVTAYDAGEMLALTSFMESLGGRRPGRTVVVRTDFIAGARAAVGLDPLRMSPEAVSHLLQSREAVSQRIGDEDNIPLAVRLGETYSVCWDFAVYPLARLASGPAVLRDVAAALDAAFARDSLGARSLQSDELLYTVSPEVLSDTERLATMMAAYDSLSAVLPAGYRLGTLLDGMGQLSVAVLTVPASFRSQVSEAVPVTMLQGDSLEQVEVHVSLGENAVGWADFTRENTGRYVWVEIDGQAVDVQWISAEVTDSAWNFMLCGKARINELFSETVILEQPDGVLE